MKGIRKENARTRRERYSYLIGYNFGSDKDGNDQIYNGAYWDEDTGKKQYEFILISNKIAKSQEI